ncbi:MAG TPA: hypothetical protein VM389_07340 [Phycisphaerae bacterium]|nr:hypothetical protein [Phycisphaerae bacterium]
MDVRWIGATAALAAVLACGGCSKGPKRASAREAERPSAPAWRAEEPSPPAPPQFPGIGPDTSNPDLSAALRHLRTQAGRRADLVDGPWSHARPGQFVTYAGAGGIRLTHKVLAVEDDGVTVETSASIGGTRLDRHPLRVPADEADSAVPATATWDSREFPIDARRLPCRVATWVSRHGSRQSIQRVWLCDQVPGRLVRSERGDGQGAMTVMLELVGLGG